MYVRGLKLIIKLTIWLIAEIVGNAISVDYLMDYSEFLFEQNLAYQTKLVALIGGSMTIDRSNLTTVKTHQSNQPELHLLPLSNRSSRSSLDDSESTTEERQTLNAKVTFSPASLIVPVLPWIAILGIYGFIVALFNYAGLFIPVAIEQSSVILAIALTGVLNLLLSWRIYLARTRFKSAIELWQTMGKAIEFLIRGMGFYIDTPTPQTLYDKESVMQLGIAFVIAMKLDWRDRPKTKLKPWVTQLEYKRLQVSDNAPLDIVLWIDDYLQRQYQQGQLNKFQLTALGNCLNKIIDLLGKWQNLSRKSPSSMMARICSISTAIYFLILPWAIVKPLGLMTGIVVGAIASIYLICDRYRMKTENLFEQRRWYYLDWFCARLAAKINEQIRLTSRFPSRLKINFPPRVA